MTASIVVISNFMNLIRNISSNLTDSGYNAVRVSFSLNNVAL